MTYDFDALLGRVEKPGRYTGGEMNAEVKPISQAEISFAFCFPDTYEVAMSHLGMKILYGLSLIHISLELSPIFSGVSIHAQHSISFCPAVSGRPAGSAASWGCYIPVSYTPLLV